MARKQYITHRIGSVHIQKRANGYWHVRYTGLDGKRVQRSLKVTNLNVAERKARELSDLLEGGDQHALELRTPTREQRITFSSFLDIFLNNFNGWGETTRQRNSYKLNVLKNELGTFPLASITRQHLEGWAVGLVPVSDFRTYANRVLRQPDPLRQVRLEN